MSEVSPAQEGTAYESPVVLGAAIGTAFFPLIALIAALLLQGNERDPVKRGQLRTWAWISGGWLALQAIIAVIIFIVFVATVTSIHPGP